MKHKFAHSLLALALVSTASLALTETSFAKRTAAEQAAKDAEKAAKKSDRIRLEAKFKLDEIEGDEEIEVENGREMYVRFRSDRGQVRLDAEASNFAVGSEFSVFVGNIMIGKITVKQTVEGLQGELSFRDANWPPGLPKLLPVGTVVKFVDVKGVAIEGPMIAD